MGKKVDCAKPYSENRKSSSGFRLNPKLNSPSIKKVAIGKSVVVTVLVSSTIGSKNQISCTESTEAISTAVRMPNLIHLYFVGSLSPTLRFFLFTILSDPSMIVPSGQIHPQKILPKGMVRSKTTNANTRLEMNCLEAIIADSAIRGLALKKRSEGIAVAYG
jgi:hypothetical protein